MTFPTTPPPATRPAATPPTTPSLTDILRAVNALWHGPTPPTRQQIDQAIVDCFA
jgi:hypothetical protein